MIGSALLLLVAFQIQAPDSVEARLQRFADSIVAARPRLPGLLIFAKDGGSGRQDSDRPEPTPPDRQQHQDLCGRGAVAAGGSGEGCPLGPIVETPACAPERAAHRRRLSDRSDHHRACDESSGRARRTSGGALLRDPDPPDSRQAVDPGGAGAMAGGQPPADRRSR